MLDIENALKNAVKEEITIHYGSLNIHGKTEDFAITFSCDEEMINFYRDSNDNSVETTDDKYILTRLFSVYKFMLENAVNVIDKRRINLPRKYKLVARRCFSNLIPMIDAYSYMYNASARTSIKTTWGGIDKKLEILNTITDDSPVVKYPEILKISKKLDDDKSEKSDSLNNFLKLSSPSIVIADIKLYNLRNSVKYKGYTFNMTDDNLTQECSIVVVGEDDKIYGIPDHLVVIAFYLMFQDQSNLTPVEESLFDLLVDNLLADDKDAFKLIKYGQLVNNYYQILHTNNVNFATVCDIAYSAIIEAAVVDKKLDTQGLLERRKMKMFIILLYMFKYLLRDVKSVTGNSQTPVFTVVK